MAPMAEGGLEILYVSRVEYGVLVREVILVCEFSLMSPVISLTCVDQWGAEILRGGKRS